LKNTLKFILLSFLFIAPVLAQGFKVSTTGTQTFSFDDPKGRNQATFFSSTPLEDVTGISNDVKGSVTFDVNDIKTLKGTVSISTGSINTGIDLRNEHMKSANWLDAESYPEITFKIKSVGNVKVLEDNKLQAEVTGDFTAHGVTKEVATNATLTYLVESEQTKQRAPGDLFGVQAKFDIVLSDYGVSNKILGEKVSDKIEITANIVGSNAK
jgi:polyisoprenoid-binding protein YceI